MKAEGTVMENDIWEALTTNDISKNHIDSIEVLYGLRGGTWLISLTKTKYGGKITRDQLLEKLDRGIITKKTENST